GSILQTSTIAEIMSALFLEEREKEGAWFKSALSEPTEPAPAALVTLRPAGPRKRAAEESAATPDSPYLAALPQPPPAPRPPLRTTMVVRDPPRWSGRVLAL